MGLHIVQEEMRRRWAGGWPDIVHMEALDIAFRRNKGQLFLDMGEIDDFFTFYNNVADDVNSLCREDILPIVGAACEGKPVDTATLVGGIHFAIPMMMTGMTWMK